MSVFGKAKAKAEELFGRAEQLYGESHGDAAATLDGEAHRLEAQAEEELEDRKQFLSNPPDDDGLAGTPAR